MNFWSMRHTMTASLTLDSIPVPADYVTWSGIENEAILLNLRNGFYYTLNEVGCESWKLMDARRAIRDIAGELCGIFEVERSQAERDLLALSEDLRREELITVASPPA